MLTKKTLAALCIASLQIFFIFTLRWVENKPRSLERPSWKTKGATSPTVTIVEYADFGCGHCNKLQPVLKEALKTFPDQLQIVFKQVPIFPGPRGWFAAEASECAADQGQFWAYHDLLFENVKSWFGVKDKTDIFVRYAENLELDRAKFLSCLKSGVKRPLVEKELRESERLGIDGVPRLLVNGVSPIKNTLDDISRAVANSL